MNKPLIFTAALMSAALVAGLRRRGMDDRQFTVTLAKEDWNIVLKILEICKETYRYLWGHEIECIIRGIKSDLDSQGF
jgi:hypothetical protein